MFRRRLLERELSMLAKLQDMLSGKKIVTGQPDRVIWEMDSNGLFSVAKLTELMVNTGTLEVMAIMSHFGLISGFETLVPWWSMLHSRMLLLWGPLRRRYMGTSGGFGTRSYSNTCCRLMLWGPLHIVAITPPSPTFPVATVAWSGESTGRFSVKFAYMIVWGKQVIISRSLEDLWIGSRDCKKSMFSSLVCCDKFMTNDERMRRNFTLDSRCLTCGYAVEDSAGSLVEQFVATLVGCGKRAQLCFGYAYYESIATSLEVQLVHVHRSGNLVADGLANLANSESRCVTYFEFPTASIVHALHGDAVARDSDGSV
ncbi:hypothetical protein V6N13_088868 [Hibiscus sabdariffa]